MSRGEKFKLAVFASGRGSNLQSIINAVEAGCIEAMISVVLSDVEGAPALERARKHGIDTLFLDPKKFSPKEEFERAILELPAIQDVGLICLAGFMRILSPYFLREYPGKVMNIHPSLLPSFPGLRAQRKALEHGMRFSGCTVHFVDEKVDMGPIIIQAVVPIYQKDTEESLSERVLALEHRIYPQAIQWYVSGRLRLQGHRVILEGEEKGRGEGAPCQIHPPLDD